MLVNLASLPVLPQEPPEDPHPSQPHDLGRHPRLGRTLPLTRPRVPSLPLGSLHVPNPGTGVDDGGLDDDVSILEELADAGSGVGVANLGGLLGVEPDLPLADAGDVGGQSEGSEQNERGYVSFPNRREDGHFVQWGKDRGVGKAGGRGSSTTLSERRRDEVHQARQNQARRGKEDHILSFPSSRFRREVDRIISSPISTLAFSSSSFCPD